MMIQQNVMRWGGTGVGLPNYVHNFSQQLVVAQMWIDKGGPDPSTNTAAFPFLNVTMGPTQPTDRAASDGELEINVSVGELPLPQGPLPKVCHDDQVHIPLDKGNWAVTLAVQQGAKIFIDLSLVSDLRPNCVANHLLGKVDKAIVLSVLHEAWAQMLWPGQMGVWTVPMGQEAMRPGGCRR